MKQDEIRLRLIDGAIHIIAKDGLDKASTKQIGIATSTNEAYIYRCFLDKEDLFTKVFDALMKNSLPKPCNLLKQCMCKRLILRYAAAFTSLQYGAFF